MATLNWIGNAHDVKQIGTITIADTWAAGDTATMTINGKDLVVTVGSTTTTNTLVATAIKEAWQAATRLDGSSSSSNATSNFGGQEFGEFSEVTASSSGSVVTLIAKEAGVPFTLTVTEATATTGTATGATSTAATGKHFWSNADNWSTGSVPANDDIVVFKDSDVSVLYGLPNGSLEVTMQVWMSYTGEIGLPAINRNGKPYYEYRQRYVRLDDAGTGSNIAHRFGLGKDGAGPRLINLKHSTVMCSPIVYDTGRPVPARIGTKALNICCTANTSTINILGGSVDFSSQDGSTSAFVTVSQAAGDSRGVLALDTGATVTCSGGTMLLGGSTAIGTINVRDGALRCENQSGTITLLNVFNGAVEYESTGTLTTLGIYGGTFDARKNSGAFTVTNGRMYAGRFLDPYKRMVIGTNFVIYFEPSPDLQFGTYIGDGMEIVP